ncbi:MAG: hypothetical protein ACYTFY_05760 [Planctomycetota bacterium]
MMMYIPGDFNRITAFGLSRLCPFGIDHSDCPFKKMRKLTPEECDVILSEMEYEELMRLINYHEICSVDGL